MDLDKMKYRSRISGSINILTSSVPLMRKAGVFDQVGGMMAEVMYAHREMLDIEDTYHRAEAVKALRNLLLTIKNSVRTAPAVLQKIDLCLQRISDL